MLKQLAKSGIYEEFSFKVAAVFPHLVLSCVKLTNDGSVTKTLARRLHIWCQGCLDELLLEARAPQYKLRKIPRIGKIDEVKQFNKFMETGKISNAIKCLNGEIPSRIIS